jgi:hypothetical protein
MKTLKTNYLIYMFSFVLWGLLGIDPVLCESIDSSNEESLLSNENNLDEKNQKVINKIIIMTGIIVIVTITMFYFTGENFSDRFDDGTMDTVIKTITNVAKEIPHKRTEAERIAFLKTYHIGLHIPSYW